MKKGLSKQTVKSLPRVDRPREKLIAYGPGKLSNAELMAILLGTGRKGENVIALSEKILRQFGGQDITTIDVKTFSKLLGLGPAKSCTLVAAFELGKRLIGQKQTKIHLGPEDIWKSLYDIRDNKKEYFVAFFLDSRSQEIKREVISVGSLNNSIVHPREVFEPAVMHTAAHIILAHNHPSGDPTPSDIDIIVTKRLVEAGDILGIDVLDHIIVTKQSYVSLKQRGLM